MIGKAVGVREYQSQMEKKNTWQSLEDCLTHGYKARREGGVNQLEVGALHRVEDAAPLIILACCRPEAALWS